MESSAHVAYLKVNIFRSSTAFPKGLNLRSFKVVEVTAGDGGGGGVGW